MRPLRLISRGLGLVSVKRHDAAYPVEHHDPKGEPDNDQAEDVGKAHPYRTEPPAHANEPDRSLPHRPLLDMDSLEINPAAG